VGLGSPGMNMVFKDIVMENLNVDIALYFQRDAISAPKDMSPMSSNVLD
jgi:hypothetical protein